MNYRPKEGALLLGKYEIASLIGEGAFGCVYRARFLKLDRDVAIKFINPNDQILPRFMDELAAIKKLDHPNIVRLFDYDILKEGVPCIVMEFVDGRELGDVIIERGPFDCASICEIAMQIIDALVETHNQGIIHCDLKPENIMLTSIGARKNVVKLIDFGVASILSKANENREHMLIGTPQYMAPEQILHQPLGPWTDVYAIGLILIEMFTGRFVFDAEDPREVLRMQLYKPVEIPHALACTPLGSIIARATEKDVAKRYNHTQDLYDDLRDAAATFQPVHRSTMMETDGSWRRSRSVHSVFTDINDLLVPPGAGAPVVPELRSKAKRGSIEVPLMGGNAGDNGAPMGGDPSDFDVTRLNLGGFQHALDDLTPQAANSQAITQPKRPSFSVPVLERGNVAPVSPVSPASSVPQPAESNVPVLTPESVPQRQASSEQHVAVPKLSQETSISHNDALDRIEKAAAMASQGKPSNGTVVNETDLRVATQSSNRAPRRVVSHVLRNLMCIVLFAIAVAGVGGYLWSSGLLVKWGIVAAPIVAAERDSNEPIEVSQNFVKYSTIRDASREMAYVAAISGYMGASRDVAHIVEYRVIGTPTDAAIYLNNSVVCGRTPCKINVYGPIEAMKLEIRKGGKSTTFNMPKRVNRAEPMIMVLK